MFSVRLALKMRSELVSIFVLLVVISSCLDQSSCWRTVGYTTIEYETKRFCCPGYTGLNCDTRTGVQNSTDCIDVTRSQWGARSQRGSPSSVGSPMRYIIHHSDRSRCNSKSSCIQAVKDIQDYHMRSTWLLGKGWDDIGYNFLIGDDGNVYEGRGWTTLGAHSKPFNNNSIGICVLGTHINSAPSSKVQETLKRFMACGVTEGYMSSTYDLHGHRDVKCTECPGQAFYNLLTTWPRFEGCLVNCTSTCHHCCKTV